MKIRIALGFCIALGAGFVSIHAADTPAQAAARAALEHKLVQPNAWESQPLTALTTSSVAVVKQPSQSATNVTGTVPEKAGTPPTVPVAITPAPAPVAETPAPVVSAVVAPTAVTQVVVVPAVAPVPVARVAVAPVAAAPVAAAPAAAFPILSLLLVLLLMISLLLISFLLLKLRQVKLLLLKHPAVATRTAVAPPVAVQSKIQPAATTATGHPGQRRK